MKKIFLFIIIYSITTGTLTAQKAQRIAYIDAEYILENIPEYIDAQAKLNDKVKKWEINLDNNKRELEILKTDLAAQKVLLTKEMIQDKEEDILIKESQLRELRDLYFGPKGDLFFYRKQLVKPIQDQMYNAVREIAESKNYDFVFDKNSDLIMLYSNKAYDLSELVLNNITRVKQKNEREVQRQVKVLENNRPNNVNNSINITSSIEREATRIAREEQQKAIITEKQSQREEQRQNIIKQREENLRKREEAKQPALKKKEVSTTLSKTTQKVDTVNIKKDSLVDLKIAVLDSIQVEKDSLTPQQRMILDRQLKKEAAQKAIEERRLESIKQREAQQKALQEKREKALKEREEQKKKDNN
ncbi:MAG: OmpH family outer membrane protein [Flavobacteriaceae bacterium]|nr:OmpH family outer membrane protein [Flavobacteriaceae bacterium]